MSTNLYLTGELADIQPASGVYYRLKLGARSDNPSLVRSVTDTEAGPTSGIQLTRSAGGTAIAWITDRLTSVPLTAAAWSFHIWAKESAAAANAALRFQILPFTVAEQSAALDDNGGTELGTASADVARTSDAATATAMSDGNRLVLKILLDDAGTMGADQTVTMSFNGQDPGAEGDSYVVCPDTLRVTAQVPPATITRVRTLLFDVHPTQQLLTDEQINQLLDMALREYSADRPRVATAALSGDGSTADFALPRYWMAGFSTIQELEYPAGEQIRTVLGTSAYEILEGVLGTQPTRLLHFPQITPDSGTNNLLLRYTTRHVHTDELDTVPPGDLDAVCLLAAVYGAKVLAAKAANAEDAQITVDTVSNYGGWSATPRYLELAKAYRMEYERHMGQSGTVSAGYVIADWNAGWPAGTDRIFHSRRWVR